MQLFRLIWDIRAEDLQVLCLMLINFLELTEAFNRCSLF